MTSEQLVSKLFADLNIELCDANMQKYEKVLAIINDSSKTGELRDGETSSIGQIVCMGNHVFSCPKCHRRYDWAIEYDDHEGFYCKICNTPVDIKKTDLRLVGIIHPLDGGW